MQSQRKVAHRRRVHFFMRIQPPLEKLGGLTWKGAQLIFKFSKPHPTTFETPKVQPPFLKGGFRAMVTWPYMGICFLAEEWAWIGAQNPTTTFGPTIIFNSCFWNFRAWTPPHCKQTGQLILLQKLREFVTCELWTVTMTWAVYTHSN